MTATTFVANFDSKLIKLPIDVVCGDNHDWPSLNSTKVPQHAICRGLREEAKASFWFLEPPRRDIATSMRTLAGLWWRVAFKQAILRTADLFAQSRSFSVAEVSNVWDLTPQ